MCIAYSFSEQKPLSRFILPSAWTKQHGEKPFESGQQLKKSSNVHLPHVPQGPIAVQVGGGVVVHVVDITTSATVFEGKVISIRAYGSLRWCVLTEAGAVLVAVTDVFGAVLRQLHSDSSGATNLETAVMLMRLMKCASSASRYKLLSIRSPCVYWYGWYCLPSLVLDTCRTIGHSQIANIWGKND